MELEQELKRMESEQGTYYIGSDRYAFQVVSTISPCRKLVSLHEGTRLIAISRRQNGTWHEMGHDVRSGRYVFGVAQTTLDPNF